MIHINEKGMRVNYEIPAHKNQGSQKVREKKHFPIGTWKMPYGENSGRYLDASPNRGVQIPGTGKPKGAAH